MSRRVELVLTDTYVSASSGLTSVATTRRPTPADLALVSVVIKSTTIEVTTMSWGGGGTAIRLARQVGTASAIELWAIYNLPSAPADANVRSTLTASVNHHTVFMVFQNGSMVMGAPTVLSTVGATATSTTVNAGNVTPTINDETQLVFGCAGVQVTAGLGASISAQGSSEGSAITSHTGSTAFQVISRRPPNSLVPHGVSTTVANAEWVALNTLLSLTTPTSTTNVHVYKGRALRSLDTIGAP